MAESKAPESVDRLEESAPHPLITHLDCLRHIFSYLNLADRRSVELSCKFWRDVVTEVPLGPSVLIITCERCPPPRFLVKCSGMFKFIRLPDRLLPPVSTPTTNPYLGDTSIQLVSAETSGETADESEAAGIDNNTNASFGRLFSTYGYALSALHFGGDGRYISDTEAALSGGICVVALPRIILRNVSEFAWKNLSSISLRSVKIDHGTWLHLAETMHDLTTRGCLDTFCMHHVDTLCIHASTGQTHPDCMMLLAAAIQRLKRFGCSFIPSTLVDSIGAVAASVRKEDGFGGQARLRELFIPMRQNNFVSSGAPDEKYLSVLQAADIIDLGLHIFDFHNAGVAAALLDALQLVGLRLRILDLRLWWNERVPLKNVLLDPVPTVSSALDPVLDSIREFHLFGSEVALSDDRLSALVERLISAPHLRDLSLGKVCSYVRDFLPLGNLINLERLYLSYCLKLNDKQLLEIVNRLVNVKRLWLMKAPMVTDGAIMSLASRVEALEIAKCVSFSPRRFVERLLRNLRESSSAVNLEFFKIRACEKYDMQYINRAKGLLEEYGVEVSISGYYREFILILKNHDKWRGVYTIRPPWYNCEFCGAELSVR